MTDAPLVVMPSYGRAGRTTTQTIFRSGVVVVPESQRSAYEAEEWPDGWEVVTIPDDRDGSISRKRNAILDMYEGRDIIMVDDDYDHLGTWPPRPKGYKQKGFSGLPLNHEQIDLLLTNGFQMARDVGTPLWGINVAHDRRFYREFAPFAFVSIVLGPFQGIVGELLPKDLRNDETLKLKDDYDFALKVLHRFHKIVRLNRYYYLVDHLYTPGGIVSYRNMEDEMEESRRLERRWGSAVWKAQSDRSINAIVKVPLKGI